MSLIDDIGIEEGKDEVPVAHPGDTVQVHYLIREGDKERVQVFSGTVLAIQGRGIARSVLVRRIVQGEGVERRFPLHSPRVKAIEISRRGKVRRAKLYYLRDRVGKRTRVGELLGSKARRGAGAAGPVPDETPEANAPDETPAENAPESVEV